MSKYLAKRPAPAPQPVRLETASTEGFAALGLRPELLAALQALGYEEPTPIQREAIPLLLAGGDVLGQAATGTGKTAAFTLPLLQRIVAHGARPFPTAVILVPTRELAMQVADAVHRYGRQLDLSVLPVYGGQPMGLQLQGLKRGVDVVVATPGRAVDHLRRHTLRLDRVRMLVLDEADEMLDMGFAEDLEAILKATPAGRQTALFSATMPPGIEHIARRHLKNPALVTIAHEPLARNAMPRIRQQVYVVPRLNKLMTLTRILEVEAPPSALVFCRTRLEVEEITERLNALGYRAEALHGGLSQPQRDRVVAKFRSGKADLLLATDVAARGLDIPRLSHVINYDVPSAPQSYVHRIGRTGRAGREGVAITIAEPREHRLLRNIEHLTKQRINIAKLPTVADIHAKRVERLQNQVVETLRAGGYEAFCAVVESLKQQFDPSDIAAAALKMASTERGDGAHAEEDHSAAGEDRPERGRAHQFRQAGQDFGHARFRERQNPGRGSRPHGHPRQRRDQTR